MKKKKPKKRIPSLAWKIETPSKDVFWIQDLGVACLFKANGATLTMFREVLREKKKD